MSPINKNNRVRFPFKELVIFLNDFGWFCFEQKEDNFPYSTSYWVISPETDNHKKSDYIKKFLYACGYFEIDINYESKKIFVYI